jgi:hypothetical protein
MGVVIDEVTGSVEPESPAERGAEYQREGQSAGAQQKPDIRGELRHMEMRETRLRAD